MLIVGIILNPQFQEKINEFFKTDKIPTIEIKPPSHNPQIIAKLIFEKSNKAREENGRKPLVWHNSLAKLAYEKSMDMGLKNYFDHTSPEGETFEMRLRKAGFSIYGAGENIFLLEEKPFLYSSDEEIATKVVNGWLNSPGHRANLLDPEFKYTGVGVYITNGKVYVTAIYKMAEYMP